MRIVGFGTIQEPQLLTFGVVLVALGLILAVGRQRFAASIHTYYNSLPDPAWRPRWLPVQFRPTPRQALILVWAGFAFLLVLGSTLIVLGVG